MTTWTRRESLIPNAGQGLFATTFISLGTIIISEPPRIRLHSNASGAVSLSAIRGLSEEDKEFLNHFSAAPRSETSRLTSAAAARGAPGKTHVEIFTNSSFFIAGRRGIPPIRVLPPNISRINHSCFPNAVRFWHDITNTTHSMVLIAACDIKSETELLIDYKHTDEWPDTQVRRASLQEYGFEWQCEMCNDPVGANEEFSSTSRHIRLQSFYQNTKPQMNRWPPDRKVEKLLWYVREVELEFQGPRQVRGVSLAKYMDTRLKWAYELLAEALKEDGQGQLCIEFNQKAHFMNSVLNGPQDNHKADMAAEAVVLFTNKRKFQSAFGVVERD